jgi:predicted RNA-binding Zn-ribbon protein involved in translation (DUF1610 family)
MTETFPCLSCGAPNQPAAGAVHMACEYCGANLTIPEELRAKAKPSATVKPPKTVPAPSLEKEAPELLRKVQPVAIKAWNAYAYWTWLRWLIPACLTIIVVGLIVCVALGALPFLLFQ